MKGVNEGSNKSLQRFLEHCIIQQPTILPLCHLLHYITTDNLSIPLPPTLFHNWQSLHRLTFCIIPQLTTSPSTYLLHYSTTDNLSINYLMYCYKTDHSSMNLPPPESTDIEVTKQATPPRNTHAQNSSFRPNLLTVKCADKMPSMSMRPKKKTLR